MERYHYTESGLDTVFIEGLVPTIDEMGEEVIQIPHVIGLHKCIAHALLNQAGGLKSKDIRFLRSELGMTQAELAKVIHKDSQTIGRWERGESPIDETAEVVLRLLAAEKLDIKTDISVTDMAEKCLPSAKVSLIVIDGREPANYHVIDVAA